MCITGSKISWQRANIKSSADSSNWRWSEIPWGMLNGLDICTESSNFLLLVIAICQIVSYMHPGQLPKHGARFMFICPVPRCLWLGNIFLMQSSAALLELSTLSQALCCLEVFRTILSPFAGLQEMRAQEAMPLTVTYTCWEEMKGYYSAL